MEGDDRRQPSVIKRVDGLVQALDRNTILEGECFPNLLWTIVAAEETTWRNCLEIVPSVLRPKLSDFARTYLLSVDFMPDAAHFVASDKPADREAKQRESRPRYISLLALIEEMSCTDR